MSDPGRAVDADPADRVARERAAGDRPGAERAAGDPVGGERAGDGGPGGEGAAGDRPGGEGAAGDRPAGEGAAGDRPGGERAGGASRDARAGGARRLDDRLVGIDLARFVALVGMMAAHTLGWLERPPAAVVALIDGPPSTLFAILGGVSVVLATRSRLAAGDRAGAVRATVVRGLAVLLLGLLVIPLASVVYVVLVPFGIAIALAALLVLLPSWLLAVLAIALGAAGGSIVLAAHERLPLLEGSHSLATLWSDPLATLADVALTGVYPVITWITYLLIGMLVARGLLAARARGRERVALLAIGATGAALVAVGVVASELGLRLVAAGQDGQLELVRDVVLANGYGAAKGDGFAWQLLAAPHSGTPGDVARTAGIALLVIAVLGLLASLLPPRALRLAAPLRAAGAAPLTIYIVHVVLLSLMTGLLLEAAPGAVSGASGWALQVAVAIVIGAVLSASGARGPLERVVGWVAERAARRDQAAGPR